MNVPRFARITAPTGYDELPVGDIFEIAFYEREYMVGHGLDQQTVGIKIRLGDERYAVVPNRAFEYVGAGEAKAWRTAQKRQRSRTRRGLA